MIMEKNPNPTKDQHFMVDHEMLELIYDTANIQPGESIVEIGGGEGALTDYLIQGGNYVTVIEKDPYYAAYLRFKYQNNPNVEVIEGDALNCDFSRYDRVVANLPYTITEPFLMNLAKSGALDYNVANPNGSQVKSVTLVLSQNSTRKMVAPVQITEGKSRHANSEFGLMGAICKSFCDVDIVRAIPSEAFNPAPAVTSFLVNLTPKKPQTTIDRILRELLMDKKGNHPSIRRIYQLMLAQGKLYKVNKHKGNEQDLSSTNFTSSLILNQNIYDLNNGQVSQLVQDLIRNDQKIKSKRTTSNRRRDYDDLDRYYKNGRFNFDENYDLDDDFDDDEDERIIIKPKHEQKYEYMYDSTQYDVLLHRGLEYVDPDELQLMLGKEIKKDSSLRRKLV